MSIKKLMIILSSLVFCTASAFTVYFMFMDQVPVSDTEAMAAGVRTVSKQDSALVSTKTSIIKRDRYSKGVPVTIDKVEAAGPENLGMNRKAAEEFYGKSGFLVIEFTDERVVLLRDTPKWPPNYYVVKEDEGILNISYADAQGNLNYLKAAELEIESVPQEDQIDLKKGLAFKTLQEIENMLEEYDS